MLFCFMLNCLFAIGWSESGQGQEIPVLFFLMQVGCSATSNYKFININYNLHVLFYAKLFIWLFMMMVGIEYYYVGWS